MPNRNAAVYVANLKRAVTEADDELSTAVAAARSRFIERIKTAMEDTHGPVAKLIEGEREEDCIWVVYAHDSAIKISRKIVALLQKLEIAIAKAAVYGTEQRGGRGERLLLLPPAADSAQRDAEQVLQGEIEPRTE